MPVELPEGVEIAGAMRPGYDDVLSRAALAFLADLHRRFDDRRRELLEQRISRQRRLDAGERPDFRPDTAAIREADWSVAPLPADLLDRRVEITGPVDRKMIVNALNSGASVFMADFEDASTPTWANMVEGQANLAAAVRREIDFTEPQTGRAYRLNDRTAVLFVRPRGWHLPESHLRVDGAPMSGALFDFGLHFFHNARELLARGSGPYFYLPKLESQYEARLWNDVFVYAQATLGVPQKSIKATVLIETVLAAFEMDEILWELRDHSAGLNCGRWDYIFSFIKKFRAQPWAVLPDRAQVTMTAPFLRSYSQLLIRTCHRREVHAMGGMAAQIPIKNDPAANETALERVRADKKREASDGHDGTWVAHPGLVAIARAEFDAVMKGANQFARKRRDVQVTAADLVAVPEGSKTEAGLRQNVAVGLGYVEAWLRGIGCVPLFNLMEDAATAEISRAQLWQWRRHGQSLDDGRPVTGDLIRAVVREEIDKVRAAIGDAAYAGSRYADAAGLLLELVEAADFAEFLTLPAYQRVLADERAPAQQPVPPPATMKAAYIEGFGGPEVLVYGDLPAPVAGPGQVVVDLVAASVNGADPKVCAGEYKQATFPVILGRDFSGVVRAVGPGVDDLRVGDAVFGVLETGRDGTYCEQIAVGAAVVARKPPSLSHVEAAAIGLIGLTAICAVEHALELQAGEKILIQGGAGGVASFAIQLAKHLGARVVSTASTANLDYVRSLGADQVIDYTTTDFTEAVGDCDAVFETVGGDVATRSFQVLKPGGRAAFIASGPQAPVPERSDVVALRPAVPRERRHFERIAALVEQGAVRLPQITTHPLAAARAALEVSAARHLRGKLVLAIR